MYYLRRSSDNEQLIKLSINLGLIKALIFLNLLSSILQSINLIIVLTFCYNSSQPLVSGCASTTISLTSLGSSIYFNRSLFIVLIFHYYIFSLLYFYTNYYYYVWSLVNNSYNISLILLKLSEFKSQNCLYWSSTTFSLFSISYSADLRFVSYEFSFLS